VGFRVKNRPVIVVAAVIEREDGKLLIGQRKADDRHPFKWEFPGGKVERGESPLAALVRELREELCIHADIGPEIARYEHRYPNRPPILLIFFRVARYEGELLSCAFEQIRWEDRERLPEYDFLDGDLDFVRRLASQEL
jgi:8-oxo-dGTP diphosphatase